MSGKNKFDYTQFGLDRSVSQITKTTDTGNPDLLMYKVPYPPNITTTNKILLWSVSDYRTLNFEPSNTNYNYSLSYTTSIGEAAVYIYSASIPNGNVVPKVRVKALQFFFLYY